MIYTVCIGSNECRKENLLLARNRLRELFHTVYFSTEEDTEPLFIKRSFPFSNQLARFESSRSADEVILLLKTIEMEAGRTPDDKKMEIVRLDIDLLLCDDVVVKPDDMNRDYISRGLSELSSNY